MVNCFKSQRVRPQIGGMKRAHEIITRMNPIGWDTTPIASYVETVQKSTLTTDQDRQELRELSGLIRNGRVGGHMTIREIIANDGAMDFIAMDAQTSMYGVVLSNPDILQFFRTFTAAEGFQWTRHPMLTKLRDLVESDGHTLTSFSHCCEAVQKRLLKTS